MGFYACPIDTSIGSTETLQNRYEETMARLQKIKNADYNVISVWGV
jgi:hypothetical protein